MHLEDQVEAAEIERARAAVEEAAAEVERLEREAAARAMSADNRAKAEQAAVKNGVLARWTDVLMGDAEQEGSLEYAAAMLAAGEAMLLKGLAGVAAYDRNVGRCSEDLTDRGLMLVDGEDHATGSSRTAVRLRGAYHLRVNPIDVLLPINARLEMAVSGRRIFMGRLKPSVAAIVERLPPLEPLNRPAVPQPDRPSVEGAPVGLSPSRRAQEMADRDPQWRQVKLGDLGRQL